MPLLAPLRLPRLALAAAVLLVALATALPATASAPATGRSAVAARALVAQSLRFRQAAGLATGPALVRRLVARRARYARSLEQWGVPLTEAESAALAARSRVEARIPLLSRWIHEHARAAFAGLWVDQRDRGLIRVGFTRDVAHTLARLRRVFPYPSALRAFRARHSERRLAALAASVPLTPALGVTQVAADPEHGMVAVGARRPSAALLRLLRRRHPTVPIELVAATPLHAQATERYVTYPSPPMIGALEIHRRQTATTFVSCSAGFIAQGSVNPRHFWVLTAGHCGDPGTDWFHQSGGAPFFIGTTDTSTLTTGSDADASIISLAPSARRGAIYINDGDIRRIRFQQRFDADYQGEPVCRSGAGGFSSTGEGNACGFLRYTDARVQVVEAKGQSHVLRNQRVADLFGCSGDSGGPIFKGATALGLVSAGNGSPCGNRTTYSQIGHVTRRLHVHVDGATVTSTVR